MAVLVVQERGCGQKDVPSLLPPTAIHATATGRSVGGWGPQATAVCTPRLCRCDQGGGNKEGSPVCIGCDLQSVGHLKDESSRPRTFRNCCYTYSTAVLRANQLTLDGLCWRCRPSVLKQPPKSNSGSVRRSLWIPVVHGIIDVDYIPGRLIQNSRRTILYM